MRSFSDRKERPIVGFQSYWTSHPLAVEIERAQGEGAVFREDCAGLYRKLEAGELSYAFCSSISLLRNCDFEIASPLGISYRSGGVGIWGLSNSQAPLIPYIQERVGQLREIFRSSQLQRTDNLKQAMRQFREQFLALPVPRLEPLPLLRMGNGSSSWSSLSRLMYRLLFGVDAYNSMVLAQNVISSPADVGEDGLDFRVENEALQKRCSFANIVDLAQIWRDITGLPFVSTILQKHRKLEGPCPQQLSESLELAQMRMRVDPRAYFPDILPRNCQQQSIDLCGVWKGMSYRLDQEDLRSLLVFLYFCKPLEKKSLEDETFTLKMLRWQQREANLMS